MTFWSSPSSTAHTVPSITDPSHHPPDQRRDDPADHPTRLQLGSSSSVAQRRHLLSNTPASLSPDSNPLPRPRRQRNSGFVQPTVSPGGLLQLVTALASSLPPSPALLGVLRRQAATVSTALATEKIDVCGARAKWWCPCCCRPHRDMACKLLKARSPCKHCGEGHSHIACPHRQGTAECAPSTTGVEQRQIAIPRQLPTSSVSDAVSRHIQLGDMWFKLPDFKAEASDSSFQTMPVVSPVKSTQCSFAAGSVHDLVTNAATVQYAQNTQFKSNPVSVYPARDLTMPFFKCHPSVPKFDKANFSRWRSEFVRYIQHVIRQVKYLEYKSIIEANPPGSDVAACAADELTDLLTSIGNDPRKLVAQCADAIGSALTANASKPGTASVPSYMLSILYDNLVAACADATDAMLIIESHGADNAWEAWVSINRKFAKAGCEGIWHVLDDMHKPNLSSDPQDQLAHHRACQAKLTGLCGAADARDEAIRAYAYLYLYNAKSEDPVIAERARAVRERMMLGRQDVTAENWATTWAAVTSSRTVQPVTEHLSYAGQRTARVGDGAPGTSRAGKSASRPTGPRPCANCGGSSHRPLVCPEQCRHCGCQQRVPVANGSLQGHFPGCVVLKSGDAVAILQTVQPQQSQQQSGSRGSSRRQQVDYHKQRNDVNQHIATFVEALKDCTDPATRAILAEGMAHARQQLEHINIQEATAAARAIAEPTSRTTRFAQDQRGYSSDEKAQSTASSRMQSKTSMEPPKSVPKSETRIVTRAPRHPICSVPAFLTASVLALLAYIGGATVPQVPQLVPSSYAVTPGLVTGTEPLAVLLRPDSTLSQALVTSKVDVCPVTATWCCSTAQPLSLPCLGVQHSADTPTAKLFATVSESRYTPTSKGVSEVARVERIKDGVCATPECRFRGGDFPASTANISSSVRDSESTSQNASTQPSSSALLCDTAVQRASPAVRNTPGVLVYGCSRFSAHGHRAPARSVPSSEPHPRAAGPFMQYAPNCSLSRPIFF